MNPMHKRWLAVAAGVTVTLLTARLGVWQLDRAAEKTALAEAQRQRAATPAWRARDWPCLPDARGGAGSAGASADVPLPVQQPVQLRGRWLSERTVFLDNRPMGGQPGFFVVTPLLLSDSVCPGGIVLVQRGWWPRDAQDRQRLPDWLDAREEIEVRGIAVPHVSQTYALGDEGPPAQRGGPLLRQNVDTAFWRAWLGQSPLPGAVLQGHPESSAAPALRRDWPQPDLGVDKHHGYAAQWFALSALSLGLTLWFSVIRARRAQRSIAA